MLVLFLWFVALLPSKQQWSCRDGQFTLPHFFLGKLELAAHKYFVHILSLVTDYNPSWINQRKRREWPYKLFYDQSSRKYGTGPGRDRTGDPWTCSQTHICSQTRYKLRYKARQTTHVLFVTRHVYYSISTLTVIRNRENNKVKATSSIFPIKIN